MFLRNTPSPQENQSKQALEVGTQSGVPPIPLPFFSHCSPGPTLKAGVPAALGLPCFEKAEIQSLEPVCHPALPRGCLGPCPGAEAWRIVCPTNML